MSRSAEEVGVMSRGPGTGWASAVVVGCITGIVLTADRLPAQVASHFGAGGLANGFSSRAGYVVWMVGIVLVVPAVTSAVLALSLHRFPQALNLPNRDYWLAPERREDTAKYLLAHSAWLAALLAMLMFAMHLLVIEANRSVPARLDTALFLTVLALFGISMAAWVGALSRRFRRN